MRRCSTPLMPMLLLAICGAGFGQTSDPGEVRIRNVRWQKLPAEIAMAYCAPDGRIWLVAKAAMEGAGAASDVAEMKAEIAGQWGRELPVLRTARPGLFEKSGRVWFISADARTHLSYDGKNWNEQATHAVAPMARGRGAAAIATGFIGDAPGHGRVMSVPINVDLGGYQIFTGSSGFTTFDGTTFSYFPAAPLTPSNVLQVLPLRSGDGAVAFQPRPMHLWKFRAGTWSEIPMPGTAAEARGIQGGAAAGYWMSLAPEGAVMITGTNPAKAESVAEPTYGFVQAAAPDGTLFLSTSSPLMTVAMPGRALSPVIVLKPTAPEDREVLTGVPQALESTATVLAPGGELVSNLAGKGIAAFDGKDWKVLWDHPYVGTELFPGNNGGVLVWQGARFAFLHDGQREEGEDLAELVRTHAEAFIKAYGGVGDPNRFKSTVNNTMAQGEGQPSGGWSIAADRGGALWLTINRTLRVLPRPQGDWMHVDWPNGSETSGASLAMPVGDGSAVYVYGSGNAAGEDEAGGGLRRDEPVAYLARLKEGKVELTPAPAPTSAAFFMDGDRALWVARAVNVAAGEAAPALGRYHVQRVGSGGVIDELDIPTMPALLDRSGYVWLESSGDSAQLYKDGKPAGEVRSVLVRNQRVFSDAVGSVWSWTPDGLVHLASSGPGAYEVKGTYVVMDEGRPLAPVGRFVGVSERGFAYAARSRQPGAAAGVSQVYTIALKAASPGIAR